MRFGWLKKSVIVGIIAMLFICYLFSLAFSINAREYQMMNKLTALGDNTFDYLRGPMGDIVVMAALGSLVILFAGGMLAALLAHSDQASSNPWLLASLAVALVTILVLDGYMLISWNDSMQKWYKNPVDEFGRPFEPIILPMLLVLMSFIDGACVLATAAGGLAVKISRPT